MTKKVLSITSEEIRTYSLEQAEEQILYVRYMIRRETQEYMLMKYQQLMEELEERIQTLKIQGVDYEI